VLGADKVTVYDYDDDGDEYPNEAPTPFLYQLIEKGYTRDVSGNTVPYTYTTRYTYNENGQIETIDGPRTDINDVTIYTYDTAGNLSSGTDALEHTTTYTDYDANGNVGRIVDPNGSITIYTYDGRNRKVQMTQVGAGPQGENLVTQYVYNSSGNLDYVINPMGGKADYTYDPADRLTSIIMRDSGGSPIETITFTYDTEGNKTGEYIRRGGEDGEVTKYTLYEYDEYSRLWKTIHPDGTQTMKR
jgi:YD repeat-containing protein